MLKILSVTALSLLLSSCGSSSDSRRVHEKQRTSSDLKISHLNLDKNLLHLRFSYRTYVEKTLTNIDCKIELSSGVSASFQKNFSLQLGAFSSEVLKFNSIDSLSKIPLLKKLSYSLSCKVKYNKGSEYIYKDSVLFKLPDSDFIYR